MDPHPLHRWVGVGAGGTPGGLPGSRSAAPGPSTSAGAPGPLPPYSSRYVAQAPREGSRVRRSAAPLTGRLPAGSPERFLRGGGGGAPGIPVPPEGSSGTRRRLPASLRCNSPQYSGAAGGLLPVTGRAPGSTPCPAPTRGPRALPWQPVAPKVLEAVNNALRVTAMAIFSGGGRCQESSLGGERPNLTQCCKVPKPNKRVFPEQKKKPENRRGFLQTLPIY